MSAEYDGLELYSTAALLDEIYRRGERLTGVRDGRPAPPCRCGAARREIEERNDPKNFLPRTGCLTCNTWDGPVVCR